ncbi:unnamed protein product [Rotaria sordida]|uniref:Uncharacterized protein n=2 Tax=Rotaria sordida TaxID=392033 RepID=A0A819WUE7_9BILA|nr:unnamed protein product [Rotaria sordida]
MNRIITQFYHYLNFNNVTYNQFNCILLNILPQIGLHIRTFVINGNLLNFILNKFYSMNFDSNLSLICPNLHILILEYFTGEQLLDFIDKIKDFSHLVKLDIKELKERRFDELIRKIFNANNHQFRSVTFDKSSIFLSLPDNDIHQISYPNIEELIINLIDCDMLGDLLKLIPNIRRLHVNLGKSPHVSLTSLHKVSTLNQLTDFQLYSIYMVWKFEDITNIISKMPYLERLVLYLFTDDERFLNRQNCIVMIPSSLVQMYFFIYYYIEEIFIETNTLLSTWPSNYITSSCILNESCQYITIHTIPFNLSTINIPTTVGQHMLPCWKYMEKVKNLNIYGEFSSIDILMIVQYFHQLQILNIHSITHRETSM